MKKVYIVFEEDIVGRKIVQGCFSNQTSAYSLSNRLNEENENDNIFFHVENYEYREI